MNDNRLYALLIILGIGILLVGCFSALLLNSALPDVLQTARGGCILSFGDGCNTTIYQIVTLNTNTDIGISNVALLIIISILAFLYYLTTHKA